MLDVTGYNLFWSPGKPAGTETRSRILIHFGHNMRIGIEKHVITFSQVDFESRLLSRYILLLLLKSIVKA